MIVDLTAEEIRYLRNLVWTEDCAGGVRMIVNGVDVSGLEQKLEELVKR